MPSPKPKIQKSPKVNVRSRREKFEHNSRFKKVMQTKERKRGKRRKNEFKYEEINEYPIEKLLKQINENIKNIKTEMSITNAPISHINDRMTALIDQNNR